MEENPDGNTYDDYFQDTFEDSYKKNPQYQRNAGVFSGAYYIRFKPQGSDKEYYRYCENSEEFFNSIFTFCDPKHSFKDINNKDWEAIQNGIPKAGMKKNILELTLGSPDNVSTYSTNKENMELWYYKNVMGKSYQILLKKDKVDSITSSEYNRR